MRRFATSCDAEDGVCGWAARVRTAKLEKFAVSSLAAFSSFLCFHRPRNTFWNSYQRHCYLRGGKPWIGGSRLINYTFDELWFLVFESFASSSLTPSSSCNKSIEKNFLRALRWLTHNIGRVMELSCRLLYFSIVLPAPIDFLCVSMGMGWHSRAAYGGFEATRGPRAFAVIKCNLRLAASPDVGERRSFRTSRLAGLFSSAITHPRHGQRRAFCSMCFHSFSSQLFPEEAIKDDGGGGRKTIH